MLGEGWEVAVLALPGESLWRIGDLRGRVEVIEADLSQSNTIARFLDTWRPGSCLHTAWFVEPGKYLESVKNIDCMQESLALLESVIASGCRQVVMLGTCFEYDSSAGLLKEDGPVDPSTLYAACKLATGLIARQRALQARINLAWARLFYLYGPDEDPRRMVPAVIQSLLGDREFPATAGDQVRDYIHVDDAASGFLTLLREGASGVFNVCSGEPMTVRGIMQTIGEELHKADLLRFGAMPPRQFEPPFICGDCSRLKALGWRAAYSLREGLRSTIDHWRARRAGS